MSHLAVPVGLSASPEVLHAGSDAGHPQPRQQHHEDPAHVSDGEGGSLPALRLLLRVSTS